MKPATQLNKLMPALDKINRLPVMPEFPLHPGDITHSSKLAEFAGKLKSVLGVTQVNLWA
jgi:hypothetical protein